MFTIWGSRSSRFCDGISRRDFLTAGTLGVASLELADLLRLEAMGAAPNRPSPKSVIMVVLFGGVSHIDTYDLKPNAPSEIRGEFRPIQTNVPGTQICELMPLQATIADKLAIVRSFRAFQGHHWLHELVTGFPSDKQNQNVRPPFGSIVSRLQPPDEMPRYVSLTKLAGSANPTVEEPGYAGAAHKPFRPDPQTMGNLMSNVSRECLEDRTSLLRAFDRFRRKADLEGELAAADAFTTRALDMITSSNVRDAFDVTQEPKHIQEKYGGVVKYRDHLEFEADYDGRLFLQARRLVEAGARVVTLQAGFWDHHNNVFGGLRALLPLLDRSIHALVTDLHDRGLDQEVAVIFWGEMGRTPKIDSKFQFRGKFYGPGRHHWPPAGSFVLAGGGLPMGQVIGATDSRGEQPTTKPIGPQNVLATLYHVLGIDPALAIPDHSGRPMHLLDDRETIAELV